MSRQEPQGIVRLASQHSVDETVSRVQAMLRQKGVTLGERHGIPAGLVPSLAAAGALAESAAR